MERIPARLRSRKFWIATLALLLVTLGKQIGIELDPAQLDAVIKIVAAFVLGQGISEAGKGQIKGLIKSIASQVPAVLEPPPSKTPTEEPK